MRHPESRRQKVEGRKQKADGGRCLRITAYCLLGLLCFCPIASTEDFPLPADGEMLTPPSDAVVGTQPVTVQVMSTKLTIEQLKTYYEHALTKQGWALQQAPWAASYEESLKKIERFTAEHPEIKDSPDFQKSVDKMQQVEELKKQQVHASRADERLMLGFSPQGPRTLVFINRWQDRQDGAFPSDTAAAAPAQAGWPASNPCCTGESVPLAMRKVPNSIPSYPNGRLISTGAPPASSTRTASEMYMTDDSPETVERFYRSQLTYNGWTALNIPSQALAQSTQYLTPEAAALKPVMLAFRNENRICGITITERPGNQGQLSGPLAQALGDSSEKTMIFVNYVESQSLERARRYRPLGAKK